MARLGRLAIGACASFIVVFAAVSAAHANRTTDEASPDEAMTDEAPGGEAAVSQSDLVLAVSEAGGALASSAEQVGPMRSGHLDARGVRRFLLTVDMGDCVTVIARGAPSLTNLDIVLFRDASSSARGRVLTQDRRAASEADVRHCFDRGTKMAVELRATGGSGSFAAAVFSASSESEARGPTDIITGESSHPVGGAGGGHLAAKLRKAHAHLEAGRPVTDRVEGNLATGKRTEHGLQFRHGRCYVVVAVGVPSIRKVDLTWIDAFGAERGGASHQTLPASAKLCPTVSGRYRVAMYMFQGYGRYALQAFESP